MEKIEIKKAKSIKERLDDFYKTRGRNYGFIVVIMKIII